MKVHELYYKTREEAVACMEGVSLVNDSDITAHADPNEIGGGWTVFVHDQSEHEDDRCRGCGAKDEPIDLAEMLKEPPDMTAEQHLAAFNEIYDRLPDYTDAKAEIGAFTQEWKDAFEGTVWPDAATRDPIQLVPAEILFDKAWLELGDQGTCDGPGGGEYLRVRGEWITANMPSDIHGFIRERANVWPDAQGKLPEVWPDITFRIAGD